MEILLFVGAITAIVVGLLLGWYLKAKRRAAFVAFAAQHGFEYSARDPFDLTAWPFRLFTRGEGQGAENVMWGEWRGVAITAFDYWYYTEQQNSRGQRSRSYRRFSCAMVEVSASFPHLEVSREGLLSALADRLGLEDIELESPEFNRRYNVRAADRQFAYTLLDARMIDWLVSFDQGLAFEVLGNRVLAYRSRVHPHLLLPLLGTLEMFRRRIPRVALSLYPVG
jgi:uncharacterized protein DUF3137